MRPKFQAMVFLSLILKGTQSTVRVRWVPQSLKIDLRRMMYLDYLILAQMKRYFLILGTKSLCYERYIKIPTIHEPRDMIRLVVLLLVALYWVLVVVLRFGPWFYILGSLFVIFYFILSLWIIPPRKSRGKKTGSLFHFIDTE